jgi:hypothetical protein
LELEIDKSNKLGVNKSSRFLEKEKMKTLSAIKINNGNSSMDVIDNELETSSNGVPNTSNNTQSGCKRIHRTSV